MIGSSEIQQTMAKKVFKVYIDSGIQLKNISENQLVGIIEPTLTKILQEKASHLPDEKLFSLIGLLWEAIQYQIHKALQNQTHHLMTSKQLKDKLPQFINPILELALKNNWIADLEAVNFNANTIKKIPDSFAKQQTNTNKISHSTVTEKKTHTAEQFLSEFYDKIQIIKNSFPANQWQRIFYAVFFTMIKDDPLFNPPSDEVFLKLGLLIHNFQNYKKSHQRLEETKSKVSDMIDHLQSLQNWAHSKKNTRDTLHEKSIEVESSIAQSFNQINFGSNNTLREGARVLKAMAGSSIELNKMVTALNNFNMFAANEIEDSQTLTDMKVFAENILQLMLLKGFDYYDPKKTAENTRAIQENVITIGMYKINVSIDKNLETTFKELEALILHCTTFETEDEQKTYLTNVLNCFSNEGEDLQKATKLLSSTRDRNFTKDKRYNASVNSSKLLREENIKQIFEKIELIKGLIHTKNSQLLLQSEQNTLNGITDTFNGDLIDCIASAVPTHLTAHFAKRIIHIPKDIQLLNEQKDRISGVISRLESWSKELSLNPATKDKGVKIDELAKSLRQEVTTYYKTVTLDKQEEFKTKLISLVNDTFKDKDVGTHRNKKAKEIEAFIVNALLFAISIPKRLITGSWLVNTNTNTQNKLKDSEKEIEQVMLRAKL